MALNIAFIAWDAENSNRYLRKLAVANAGQVKKYDSARGRVLLKDGTAIYSITPHRCLDGLRFDQVIIADDRRGKAQDRRREELARLDYLCMFSCVPEDFRYQIFDIDAED